MLRRVTPAGPHGEPFDLARGDSGGVIVGVLVGLPRSAGPAARAPLPRGSTRRMPPWRLPGLLRHLRAARGLAPSPAARSGTSTRRGRRATRGAGVARALLADAARLARERGAVGVALDTGLENIPARALYRRAGSSGATPPRPRRRRARDRRRRLRRLLQAPVITRMFGRERRRSGRRSSRRSAGARTSGPGPSAVRRGWPCGSGARRGAGREVRVRREPGDARPRVPRLVDRAGGREAGRLDGEERAHVVGAAGVDGVGPDLRADRARLDVGRDVGDLVVADRRLQQHGVRRRVGVRVGRHVLGVAVRVRRSHRGWMSENISGRSIWSG